MKTKFTKLLSLTLAVLMLFSLSACSIAEVKDKLLGKPNPSSSSSEVSSSSEESIVINDTPILTINDDYTLTVSEYEFIEDELTYIVSILQSMLTDLKDSDLLKSIDLPVELPDLNSDLFNSENTQKLITLLKTASYHAKMQGINPPQTEIDEEIDSFVKKLKLVPLALVLNKELKKTAESYVNELTTHLDTVRTSQQSVYFNTLMHDIVSVVKLAEHLQTSGSLTDIIKQIQEITKSYEINFDETQLPIK